MAARIPVAIIATGSHYFEGQAIKPGTETVKRNETTKRNRKSCPHATLVLCASWLRARASVLLHRLVFCVNRVLRHTTITWTSPVTEKTKKNMDENFYSNKDKNKCQSIPKVRIRNNHCSGDSLVPTSSGILTSAGLKERHRTRGHERLAWYWTFIMLDGCCLPVTTLIVQMLLLANKNYIIRWACISIIATSSACTHSNGWSYLKWSSFHYGWTTSWGEIVDIP